MINTKVKKEKLKEFNVARVFALIVMVAVHTEFAIYNYHNEIFATVFDYLGSPFAAPIFMFILGANIVLSSHNSPKELFIRGISLFSLSVVFNIICHALPFFIIDYRLGVPASVENSLHWIFAVDILTFAGMAFMFFAFVKKLKINNLKLAIIAFVFSVINFLLIKFCQVDFDTHTLLAAITSLFWGSSITGYFSFLGWIIFPVAGYIFVQVLLKVKDKDKFYKRLGCICLPIYLIMVLGTFTLFKNAPLIVFKEEYSYYWMNPYDAVGNIIFCLGWISLMYFIAKIIPKCLEKTIDRLNKNLTTIYLIQWFIINYFLVLPFNGNLKVSEVPFILLFILVIIVSDILAYLYSKYKVWKVSN